jgi:hypothetical protein
VESAALPTLPAPVSIRQEVIINHIRSLCPSPASLPGRSGVLIASPATAPAAATPSLPSPESAQR